MIAKMQQQMTETMGAIETRCNSYTDTMTTVVKNGQEEIIKKFDTSIQKNNESMSEFKQLLMGIAQQMGGQQPGNDWLLVPPETMPNSSRSTATTVRTTSAERMADDKRGTKTDTGDDLSYGPMGADSKKARKLEEPYTAPAAAAAGSRSSNSCSRAPTIGNCCGRAGC